MLALSAYPIEVVSADSMQVYRGMDVGTAKPDASFRARLPHHLIDILDPAERFDVGRFVELADSCVSDIVSRGRLPVVSGGTGYYFRHLLFGLPEVPAVDPEVRRRLELDRDRLGLAALRERLESVDPQSAARIAPNDPYRIVRALEVYEQTGRPRSSFEVPSAVRSHLTPTIVELTRDRAELRSRIAARVDAMLAAGLRREVERLVDAGVRSSDPGMRAIGYREWFDEAGRVLPSVHDESIAERIVTATRRYAKRQITFFHGIPDRVSVHATDVARVEQLLINSIGDLDRQ